VLTGTISVDAGSNASSTELDERLEQAQTRDVGELFVMDRLAVGQRSAEVATVGVDMDGDNGRLYPFSNRQKLDAITERCAWFDSHDTPWGRPILSFEMISVLAAKSGSDFPVRGPAVGLFLDLEIRLVDGPLFVGERYTVEREVVALGQSRQVESNWVNTTVRSATSGDHVATVLLHSGVFKASYADYPRDRLP
jgi:hypothetical protein